MVSIGTKTCFSNSGGQTVSGDTSAGVVEFDPESLNWWFWGNDLTGTEKESNPEGKTLMSGLKKLRDCQIFDFISEHLIWWQLWSGPRRNLKLIHSTFSPGAGPIGSDAASSTPPSSQQESSPSVLLAAPPLNILIKLPEEKPCYRLLQRKSSFINRLLRNSPASVPRNTTLKFSFYQTL